ncbi:hypothetical protein CN446_23230 [Bacillus cereus]|nr:hypothetical protein CN446_23230 [Bacillus cereus]PGU48807.1 hypothetical protein COD70_31245 [Bacillus cereus]PGW28029.1 hypothetical protein COE04_30840 [Bacillus cereus]
MFYRPIYFFYIPYPGKVLGFLFVTRLAEKLYKILHALSVTFFRNTRGGTETILGIRGYYVKNYLAKPLKRTCSYKFLEEASIADAFFFAI